MTDTRQRLLESACEVFARKGFHDAGVAEICELADANIAAVNYHFGGKQKLYEEVLLYSAEVAEKEHPLMARDGEAASAEDRLAHFIRAQFRRDRSEGLASCFDRIAVHEMTSPSASHETLFRGMMMSRHEYLSHTVRDLLPPEAGEGHLRVCLHNIISLFAFSRFLRLHDKGARNRACPELPPPDLMAHHATVFALGGIEAVSRLPAIDPPYPCPPREHEEAAK